jgi:hypothetical protein
MVRCMMKLNHFANRVETAHFDTIVEAFTANLGFVVLRRTERSLHMRQPGANVDVQFSRTHNDHRDEDKRRSQISFITDTPRQDLEDLAAWFRTRGLEAAVGAYSDKEFFLDVPAAFIDFVIEAMLPELAEYGVDV